MSSAYAVAAVTAVLRDRLRTRLVQANVGAVTGSVEVSAVAPDHVDVSVGQPARLNLFLHNVSFNQGWRNVGQPERAADGSRRSAPPVGLDLHYLLTAYGSEPYHAEILLGHASQELHENPVLTRNQIRAALTPAVPDTSLPAAVSQSALADQAEGLRIVPVGVPPEEMSRMWTALQAHFRPTVAFEVSVVLIDSEAVPRPSLPVLARGPAVETLRRPVIAAIENDADATAPVLASSTIAIRGEQLSAASVSVLVGGAAVVPGATSDALLTVDLGALPVPVRAGLIPVQVVHTIDLGDPPAPHAALSSEPAGLLVQPSATFTITIAATTTIGGLDFHDGTITVALAPPVQREQRVSVLLNERGAPAAQAARSYAFAAPEGNGLAPGAPPTASVGVPFAGVASATYVARASVDGADSPLGIGADGRFETPQVVLP